MDSLPQLLPHAERVTRLLIARKQTITIAESAAGGLINAALLAVPGASACCRGGLVVYTHQIRRALLDISDADMKGLTPATEAYALLAARRAREKVGSDWAGNPPVKQSQPEVEFSRNLPRGGSLEEIAIYRQPDPGRSQAG